MPSLLDVSARFRTLVTTVAAASTVLGAAPAAAAGGARDSLVSDISGAREHHELSPYDRREHLDRVAQRWAERMAAHETLEHNPNLESETGDWGELGENVGSGSDAQSIHHAFMNSPEHRANILSRSLRQVGVGAARGDNGVLYVDEVFRRPR